MAQDFLANYLPEKVLKQIDLSTLEICKDSFVQEDLNEYFSDLLYRVSFAPNIPGYIYLLFEHKSYPQRLLPLHLLEYMLNIWKQEVKQRNLNQLPLIVPLVLYHGQEGWEHVTLKDIIAGPNEILETYIPDFEYVFYDLSSVPDEDIKKTVMTGVGLLALKYSRDPDCLHKLPEIFSLLRQLLNQDTGLRYLETVLRYLLNTVEDADLHELKEIANATLSSDQEEIIMTIAEKLRQEGYQQGMQQGTEHGSRQKAREDILEVLQAKFEDIPAELNSKVENITDLYLLKSLLKSAAKCTSLKEFHTALDKLQE